MAMIVYYSIFTYIMGIYRDNEEENGNYYGAWGSKVEDQRVQT